MGEAGGGRGLARTRVLSAVAFLACIPSGGALLAEVWGLASLQFVALGISLPCFALLGLLYRHADEEVRGSFRIGLAAGLLGTVGYDLARVPFALAGMRIFAPIEAYGVWIAGAGASSRYTDLVGWLYHFSNGLSFGLMYALVMRRAHWAWGVLWGLALETLVLLSPFATLFHLAGNVRAIGIAYLGHVAYGLPVGWMVYRWDESLRWLRGPGRAVLTMVGLLVGCLLLGPLVSPPQRERDERADAGVLRVEGGRLNPGWLRLGTSQPFLVRNPGPGAVTVVGPTPAEARVVPGPGEVGLALPEPGIYQFFVQTGARSESSFVLVERR